MVFRTGDLFSDRLHDPPGIRLFSSNGAIKTNGELVMGAGAALAARLLVPAAPHAIGDALLSGHYSRCGRGFLYGLIIIKALGIGAFQTKCNYLDKSNYGLVELSSIMLRIYALSNPDLRIAMNFPGIGYGGLLKGDVLKILERHLSDMPVEVWRI